MAVDSAPSRGLTLLFLPSPSWLSPSPKNREEKRGNNNFQWKSFTDTTLCTWARSASPGVSSSGTMLPCATTWCLRTSNPSHHEKTSEKLKLGDILENTQLVLFKTLKVVKSKERWKLSEETKQLHHGILVGSWSRKRALCGEDGEIHIKYAPVFIWQMARG